MKDAYTFRDLCNLVFNLADHDRNYSFNGDGIIELRSHLNKDNSDEFVWLIMRDWYGYYIGSLCLNKGGKVRVQSGTYWNYPDSKADVRSELSKWAGAPKLLEDFVTEVA